MGQRRETGTYLETNVWDAATIVNRGESLAVNAYLFKEGTSQINNLTCLDKIEKEHKEIENIKSIEKTNKTRSWFFGKMNKIF